MGLNIKNREARLLAEELSRLTGEEHDNRGYQLPFVSGWIAFVRNRPRPRRSSFGDRQGLRGAPSRSRFVPPSMATCFVTNTDYLNDRQTSALIAKRDGPATAACAHAIENSAVRPALEPNFSPLVVDSIKSGPFRLT
jgi:hypothetical protein